MSTDAWMPPGFASLEKITLTVAFFAWSAALGKILTLDNLRKQKIIVVDWCYMRKKSWESIDHLLLHCDIASALLSSTFGYLV